MRHAKYLIRIFLLYHPHSCCVCHRHHCSLLYELSFPSKRHQVSLKCYVYLLPLSLPVSSFHVATTMSWCCDLIADVWIAIPSEKEIKDAKIPWQALKYRRYPSKCVYKVLPASSVCRFRTTSTRIKQLETSTIQNSTFIKSIQIVAS